MILDFYLARRFLGLVIMVTLVFVGLLLPLDLMEQLRRLDDEGAGIGDGLRLAALNLPAALYQILPLIVMLATLALFLSLGRSSELVVIRAAGRSAARAVLAPVVAALALGVLALVIVNPIVAATQDVYERERDRFRSGISSILSVSEEGVWLRQGDRDGQTVIRAARSSLDGTVLFEATFIAFDGNGSPEERIDAARAELSDGAWTLEDAKRWPLGRSDNPERDSQAVAFATIPSSLTENQIRDSFGVPSSIPIFELPAFIRQLDAAGFSGLTHRVWFQTELANPVMLAAMVLIGAAFTMRHVRSGGIGRMVLLALLLGFGVFFLRSFAQTLGENGQLPAWLAAWSAPLAAVMLALGVILQLEDG
ncbi:LPS export ABC transporter permease LptG [Jannaschia seohaensis]|uniref:Lipopolysaccharide export system permease protein n=1 Tax=Jannaschia seohaensis TaxID=475081 RepID=A0A2Y9ABB1_9RHOB|nr:LPS export ABC transporter permease LptG [Jannaschia seohaensis]PWJ21055.1 lipopolysaccharide export system permease protein [Jannaschia seohaensis]SSA41465.1 lipopolysaccharide export system permease protein [Jannaschia seohaensis]